MSQNLWFAAVVIGVLRVNLYHAGPDILCFGNGVHLDQLASEASSSEYILILILIWKAYNVYRIM